VATLVHDAPPPVLPPAAHEERRPPRDEWPRTTRPMPWLVALFAAMVYLIPFDSTVLPISLPFNAGLDRLVLVAMAVVWLMLSIGGRIPPRFSHTPINIAIFLWVALTALSLALNLRDLTWDRELSTAFKQLLLAYTYLLLFYMVASSLTREDVVPFCKLIVVLGVISAIGTILENRGHVNIFSDIAKGIPGAKVHFKSVVGGGGPGARHSYAGPTKHGLADATMLNAAIPFAMVLLWRARGLWPRIRWGAALLLLLAGCVATEEKTALILLIVTVFLMVALHPRRYVSWWPLLIVAVVLTRAAAPHSISQLLYQFRTLGSSNSTSGRATDYPAVAPFLNTHLIFGRGFGSYEPHKYRILDDQMLGFLIETGVAGILAYAAVILMPALAVLRAARRGLTLQDDLLAGIGAGCVAFFLSNFLYDSFSFRQGPYVFFLLAGLAAAVVGRRGSTLGTDSQPGRVGPA
jgi:O-antigen ligase/polysaccharide polymerase Wzy-like membrane protein